LPERYYDSKPKDFYELNMGLMIDEEYTTKFLYLLKYVLYIKDEKEKFQIFFSGLPLGFKYWIEYDEHWSLEEVIGKLKNCYE